MEALGRVAGGPRARLQQPADDHPAQQRGAQARRRRHAGGFQQIEEAATSAAALTTQLLAFSRRSPRTPRVLDANQVAAQSLENDRAPHRRRDPHDVRAEPSRRHARRRRSADASSDPQPRAERARRDAGRRSAVGHHQSRRARDERIVRSHVAPQFGNGNERGDARAPPRAVLHHERARKRHGARPRDRVRHRLAERRVSRGRIRAGPWLDVPRFLAVRRRAGRASGRARRCRAALRLEAS